MENVTTSQEQSFPVTTSHRDQQPVRKERKQDAKRSFDTRISVYIYCTLACFSMVRVGGMTRPFSRSAGCIMSGFKCVGRSGRMCPETKKISPNALLSIDPHSPVLFSLVICTSLLVG